MVCEDMLQYHSRVQDITVASHVMQTSSDMLEFGTAIMGS